MGRPQTASEGTGSTRKRHLPAWGALDNTTMRGQPQAISANIDLVSSLMAHMAYGESLDAITDIDTRMRQVRHAVGEK